MEGGGKSYKVSEGSIGYGSIHSLITNNMYGDSHTITKHGSLTTGCMTTLILILISLYFINPSSLSMWLFHLKTT